MTIRRLGSARNALRPELRTADTMTVSASEPCGVVGVMVNGARVLSGPGSKATVMMWRREVTRSSEMSWPGATAGEGAEA